jgi:hypothetical protein
MLIAAGKPLPQGKMATPYWWERLSVLIYSLTPIAN